MDANPRISVSPSGKAISLSLVGQVARALQDFEFVGAPFFGVGRAGLFSGYPAVS
jgi:hypothetical protein